MSTLKQMVPVSVKTTVKSLPGIKTWFERKKLMERYDAIVNEVYNPQLIQRVEDVHIAEIEINRNCNINCVMCNTSLSTRPQFNMDMELFEHAVKYTKDQWGGHTALHTIGEPLMNKNLPQYFDILRKNGVKIHLSTNALILHKHLDLIIDYSDIIYEFRFSIDGASKETYEKIRLGGKWDRLIENMEMFREKTKDTKPFKRVKIGSIVSQDVQNEMGHHLKFWSRYVPMDQIDLNLVSGLSPDNRYFLTRSILKKHIQPWPPCYMLFSSVLHILNDGRATPCCRDYQGDLTYGNIRDSTPQELINCENVLELRRQHLENRIPEKSPCASCFCVNPIVASLFKLFVAELVQRFSDNWDAPKMQGRFNEFFAMFMEGIPDRELFATLVRA
ncbi:MAG TPA: radical SAM protein [Terracidiphilus sp.]|nr:radical SAM protein [Terracidiphilus sp.]